VQNFININTPYRGLLLYHGLGSGKTCASIITAEGLKHAHDIVVLLPASLRQNYLKELMKCGDQIYRKLQHWDFITTEEVNVSQLAQFLGIDKKYVVRMKGAWVYDAHKQPNFETLNEEQQLQIEKQILMMIENKYHIYNYNGMRRQHLDRLSELAGGNPFDNKVVIIDEVHNLVNTIANKLKSEPNSMAILLYNFLRTAKNTRIILLSGTPIINFPNELAILYNIIRGDVSVWSFHISNTIDVRKNKNVDVNTEYFKNTVFADVRHIDIIEFDHIRNTLYITRTPYGFVVAKDGVVLDGAGEVSDSKFPNLVREALANAGFEITTQNDGTFTRVTEYPCLPDNLEVFQNKFFNTETSTLINRNLLSRRILGMSSYLGDLMRLLPKFNRNEERYFEIVRVPMSDYQVIEYNRIRRDEVKVEKRSKRAAKNVDSLYKVSSTYRIYSRSACNFVFPPIDGKPGRPMRSEGVAITQADLRLEAEENDGDVEAEAAVEEATKKSAAPLEAKKKYAVSVSRALQHLRENSSKYMTIEALRNEYSPKYAAILTNLLNNEHRGIHLLYSNFKTLEGIGIFRIALEEHNYVQFKLQYDASTRLTNVRIPEGMSEDEFYSREWYVTYTGEDSPEEKETMRYACNGEWHLIPYDKVVGALREKARRLGKQTDINLHGDIIKLIMISKAGAEGISLYNVRYVHIMEPYWHAVRVDQVIGRARRINSHAQLPESERNIKVFSYLMTIPEDKIEQLDAQVRTHDKVPERNSKYVMTTDESLQEIMDRKRFINEQLLTLIKSTSFDCAIHGMTEKIECFRHVEGKSEYSYEYDFDRELIDKEKGVNIKEVTVQINVIELNGKKYAHDSHTKILYDLDKYNEGTRVKVGTFDPETKKVMLRKLVIEPEPAKESVSQKKKITIVAESSKKN
jgi:hypothetical protein